MCQHEQSFAYGGAADVEAFRYLRLPYGLPGLKSAGTNKTTNVFGGLGTVRFFFKLHG